MGTCQPIQWELQGLQFSIDFLVFLVKGCDLVIRIQWLQSLDTITREFITWELSLLTMKFLYQNKSC